MAIAGKDFYLFYLCLRQFGSVDLLAVGAEAELGDGQLGHVAGRVPAAGAGPGPAVVAVVARRLVRKVTVGFRRRILFSCK